MLTYGAGGDIAWRRFISQRPLGANCRFGLFVSWMSAVAWTGRESPPQRRIVLGQQDLRIERQHTTCRMTLRQMHRRIAALQAGAQGECIGTAISSTGTRRHGRRHQGDGDAVERRGDRLQSRCKGFIVGGIVGFTKRSRAVSRPTISSLPALKPRPMPCAARRAGWRGRPAWAASRSRAPRPCRRCSSADAMSRAGRPGCPTPAAAQRLAAGEGTRSTPWR